MAARIDPFNLTRFDPFLLDAFGKVGRTIRLPLEINENSAGAKYADDLLKLALPKKASSMPRNLAIH